MISTEQSPGMSLQRAAAELECLVEKPSMAATELGRLGSLLILVTWPQIYCFCSYRLVTITIALSLGG